MSAGIVDVVDFFVAHVDGLSLSLFGVLEVLLSFEVRIVVVLRKRTAN